MGDQLSAGMAVLSGTLWCSKGALITQQPQQGHLVSALRQFDPGLPDRVQHVLQGVESTTIRVGKYKIRFGKGERCLHCALQEATHPCSSIPSYPC